MLASSQIHRTTAPTGGFLFPHNKTVTSYAKVIIKKKEKDRMCLQWFLALLN